MERISLVLLALVTLTASAAEIRPAGRDSAALALAVQRCRRGDTLILPPGEFTLTQSLILKSGVKLRGSGQDKTVLVFVGEASDPFLRLSDCDEVEISNLTIDGKQRPLGRDGIFASNSRRLFLHHLTVRNLAKGKSSFVHAIMFSGQNPTMQKGVTDSRISAASLKTLALQLNLVAVSA